MLTHLSIRNFAIVEALELELSHGMTVVSGETGAGKSIMIDALQLALGGRADSGTVRRGSKKTEIIANFDIGQIPRAQAWLEVQDLTQEGECILRRIVTAEGRSRSYINGRICPLASLRELGQFLVAIHGQHEHQSLMQKDHHRTLLDGFAQQHDLADKVGIQFQSYHKLNKQLQKLTLQSDEQQAKVQLLSYQVEELDQLGIQVDEIKKLEEEQKTLSQADDILHNGHSLLHILSEGEPSNCLQLLNQSIQLQSTLPENSTCAAQIGELINTALIQIEEASNEVRHYLDSVELNPSRLQEVEERLSTAYTLARKHRVDPYALADFHQQLIQELQLICGSDETIAELETQVLQAKQCFLKSAEKLSKQRGIAARKLNKQINHQLHLLGMPAADFSVSLNPINEKEFNMYGLEEVEFLISTNAGQSLKPLAKIASGGELSRISLAIQVATAKSGSTATLMFDEVDVGIGGAIAEVVGRLLRQLGERSQILCITHQPQVASQGHQHLFVSKKSVKQNTQTQVNSLVDNSRVHEIARMLGGLDITKRTLEHAKEMLQTNV